MSLRRDKSPPPPPLPPPAKYAPWVRSWGTVALGQYDKNFLTPLEEPRLPEPTPPEPTPPEPTSEPAESSQEVLEQAWIS